MFISHYGDDKKGRAFNERQQEISTEAENNARRQWMESYDQKGKVSRVHPKSQNGQALNSQHYPPTGKELGK